MPTSWSLSHILWLLAAAGLVACGGAPAYGQAPASAETASAETASAGTAFAETHADRLQRYRARADSMIDAYADRADPDDLSSGGLNAIAANLYREQNMDWVKARLDTLMQSPGGDMFWMYPMTLVNFVGRDALPPEYQSRLRDLWRTYRPYRGDTENHWAMYYTSLYLMSQLRPNLDGDQWFNGKSSATNHEEAREYLLHWIDRTTRQGQGEFDSPHYMSYYVASMGLLYAYAEDPTLRKQAHMMLDYLLADFAAESLNGLYAGAFSRIYPGPLFDRWKDSSTSYAWLLFGNAPFRPRRGAMILAMSGYEPPDILHEIGTDRSEPYVHRERKRTRDRIRYSEVRSADVYKYMYMREEYALGSIQGGLLQPIQQHTWELLWAPDDPRAGHNVLFALHPYTSSRELAMYFPEEPRTMIADVVQSKGTYDSPDKWTGASPYEEVVQAKDALVALYDIPEDLKRFPHISGYFSKELTRREEDPSGWIFAQGGEALIAYHPLAEYEWQKEEEGWRLHSPHLHNGAVLQVAPAGQYPSFAAFKKAVRALPLTTKTTPVPQVQFTTLRSDRIEFTYGEHPEVNGHPVNYADWPLYDGPFLQAETGSNRLMMHHGAQRRLLDFENVTLKEWVTK